MGDQDTQNVADLFARAVSHHQRGELAAASNLYRTVLAREPRHSGSLHHLGIVELQSGRPAAALDLIGRAIALDGNVADFHFSMGTVYGSLGQFERAVEHNRKAAEIQPGHAPALMNLGKALMALGRKDEAVDSYRRAVAAMPASPDAHFNLANVLTDAGQPVEAEAEYRKALELEPRYADAHCNLGTLLAAQGRLADATGCFEQALRFNPQLTAAHFNLANALRDQGNPERAKEHYRAVLRINPNNSDANNNLGVIFLLDNKPAEAAAHFERVINARPNLAAAHRNLAKALIGANNPVRALEVLRRAFTLEQDEETKFLIGTALTDERTLNFAHHYRDFLIKALAEPWCDTRSGLMRAAWFAISGNPEIANAIDKDRTANNDHALFDADELNRLAQDQLLLTLMECELIADRRYERFATALRHTLLAGAMQGSSANEAPLNLHCAIAQQALLADFAYAQTEQELTGVSKLRAMLKHALETNAQVNPRWIAALASYIALDRLPEADALLSRQWPAEIDALLDRHVRAPRMVRQEAQTIPQFTPVDDAVSQAVARVYEESPYPRWNSFPQRSNTVDFAERLRAFCPGVPVRLRAGKTGYDVLVAGCGTGRQIAIISWTHGKIPLCAVDISRASLGYAKFQTDRLGYSNIAYGQADILSIGELGRTFDVIECMGVLHHMSDPVAGLRALLAVLRPDGCLRLGLYSETARRRVVAGRKFVADGGYGSDPDDIRRCRQDILALPDDAFVKTIASWWDFYNLNECRDLLFHVQEHRFTIPQIRQVLLDHDLEFMGFEAIPSESQRYAERFPDDPTKTNLENWHLFEQDNPDTFQGMYNFWVQRKSSGGGP